MYAFTELRSVRDSANPSKHGGEYILHNLLPGLSLTIRDGNQNGTLVYPPKKGPTHHQRGDWSMVKVVDINGGIAFFEQKLINHENATKMT